MCKFILKNRIIIFSFFAVLMVASCLRNVDDNINGNVDGDGNIEDDLVLNYVEDKYRGIPRIYIDVEDNAEVLLKEYYDATIRIDGGEYYDDLSLRSTRIKCRGNYTFSLPKKAFKLKLDDAASLLGLKSEREWVLLANYIDPAMSITAAAMKLGEYMEVPYVNHIIPVDVIINGSYRGNYNLTEQVEIQENRINLSDDGYVLELDVYFDESPKYLSSILSLPVMLKDGNYTEDQFNAVVVSEFDQLEAAIMSDDFPNNNYRELIDIESVAAFMLTNQYMMSNEVPSIKSIFFCKDKDERFQMAPIWDFDFSAGYESTPPGALPFLSWSRDTFDPIYPASSFFGRFFLDPEFVELYVNKWSEFETNNKQDYLTYIESYMTLIEESAEADYEIWEYEREAFGFGTYTTQRDRFSTWMINRFDALREINSNL